MTGWVKTLAHALKGKLPPVFMELFKNFSN